MHNSFYFHKSDNSIEDLKSVEDGMQVFITALLESKRTNLKLRVKDFGRAYINLGLFHYMQGHERSLPCGAANDLFFLDPYGQVLACNGSDDPLVMGDLTKQAFEEIWHSEQAEDIRRKVKHCQKNCWMVGTAVPAMRRAPIPPLCG